MKRIYLDNNATTRPDPAVVEAMRPFFSEMYGNPSSLHDFGTEVLPAMRTAMDDIYRLLDAPDSDDVIITSCGTESCNTVIKGVYFALMAGKERNHVICTNVEHPAVMNSLRFLEERGIEVSFLPVDESGAINAAQVAEAITERTALVSVMWANNETGAIFPVREIGRVARERGALFHTDAVQAVGKIPLSVREARPDFLSFSGHKFHGPKGVGGLYVRAGIEIPPLLHGGEQMRGMRGGTHNVAGLVGMGVAARLALEHLDDENTRVKGLRDELESFVLREIPDTMRNGHPERRTPNTASIAFAGIEGEAMLWDLNRNGIAASTGSACASESLRPSHVLRALNLSDEQAHTTIRFSLSRFTTGEDIARVKEALPGVVARLRGISMAYKKGGKRGKG